MDNIETGKPSNSERLVQLEKFKERIEKELQKADRLSSYFCLAVLYFEPPKLNGLIQSKDLLIPAISESIYSTIRTDDLVALDERKDFIILLSETTNELAELAINRIYKKFETLNTDKYETSMYTGLASYPGDCKNYQELIQGAKFAMFNARETRKTPILSITTIKGDSSWNKEANQAIHNTKKKFNHIIEMTIKSLLTTFATKDPYLEEHSRQVSKISSIFAESLGLKENYVQEIMLAALLHDVGYLDVPGEILYKRGPLTVEEMNVVKQHPLIATEKILKPVKSLESILPIILDHHERWDGEGYPHKKSQRQIHIGARILSIADAYHAMTCDRPYRKALSKEQIIDILKAGMNHNWEDKLVQAFLEMLSDREFEEKLQLKGND